MTATRNAPTAKRSRWPLFSSAHAWPRAGAEASAPPALAITDRQGKSVRVRATATPALRLDASSPWRRRAPDQRVGSGR